MKKKKSPLVIKKGLEEKGFTSQCLKTNPISRMFA